jgi:hypothetical protein
MKSLIYLIERDFLRTLWSQRIAIALVFMLGLIATIFGPACAFTQQQRVLATERALEAGSEALDIAVEAQIEVCRSKQLPTEAEREACVEKIAVVNEAAEPVVTTAVAAMRAYWAAAAANDKEAAERALLALKTAIANLPDEYFVGIKQTVEKLR